MKQRRPARRPEAPAVPMFPNHDDLPLFSGTPQIVADSPFTPKHAPELDVTQISLFDEEQAQ